MTHVEMDAYYCRSSSNVIGPRRLLWLVSGGIFVSVSCCARRMEAPFKNRDDGQVKRKKDKVVVWMA